jgi:hypothetical protein
VLQKYTVFYVDVGVHAKNCGSLAQFESLVVIKKTVPDSHCRINGIYDSTYKNVGTTNHLPRKTDKVVRLPSSYVLKP